MPGPHGPDREEVRTDSPEPVADVPHLHGMITSMPHDRIHHGFQCRHVNIALPEGPGQDRIPDLLRAAAATIEEMETDGPIGVMDVLLHYDLEAGANRPHVTLYYYFPEEDEEL